MGLAEAPSRAAQPRAPALRDRARRAMSGPAPARRRPAAPAAILAAAATLILAGCETTTAPPPDPAAVTVPRRIAPATPRAIRAADAVWSFRTEGASCAASAAHPALTLTVAVRDGRTVEVSLRPGAGVPAARRRDGSDLVFSGPAGSWRARGRAGPARAIVLAQPLDEVAAGRILVMLEGGAIEVGGPGMGWPVLRLPPSGAAGRGWFECVRRQLLS